MKVILLQDIYKHGVAGEIVDVASGFARNYLIPRGMAKKASSGALKEHQNLMEQVEARRAQYENMLNDLGRQIDGVELIFERRASPTGTLYGSVTTLDIAEALDEKTGIDINRRRISQQPIRELGEFDIPVRLGTDVSPILHIVVVRTGELEEFLAAREAAGEGEVVDIVEMEIVPEVENELPEDAISEAAEVAAEEVDNRSELQKTIDEAVEELEDDGEEEADEE